MDRDKLKFEIIDLLQKTGDKAMLLKVRKVLKEGIDLRESSKSLGSEDDEQAVLARENKETYETRAAVSSSLKDKEKVLREALEEGEKSRIVENFNIETFLQELHRKHQ